MKNRSGEWRDRLSAAAPSTVFSFLFSLFLVLAGCGAPAEPTPPRQPVPEAVTDLKARQLGDGVLLTFTLPKKAVDGIQLESPPAVEIFRATVAPSPANGAKSTKAASQPVFTIPGAMVQNYLADNLVEFRDPLPPDLAANSAGQPLSYTVRTRASRKRASADSNVVSLRVYPTPPAIGDVQTKVTETAIELSWSPPAMANNSLPPIAGYRIYRAELPLGTGSASPQELSKARKTPLALLAESPGASFRDTQFEFDHEYLYFVRSVVPYGADVVESADSNAALVTPHDIFPPAPPKNIVAIAVPAAGDSPAHVELSWSIGTETDLAGYNVYRLEGDNPSERGERLNKELVLAPAFRDLTAVPGRRYTYRVTSVDRTGNESAPGDAVTVELPPRTP